MNKKNKAFTLIEVIVVLVILAIIALIAVPVINTIKEKSREKSYRLSVDNYGHAIELALNAYELDTGMVPSSIDDIKVEYSGNKVDCKVIKLRPNQTVYLSECFIDDEAVEDKKNNDKYYHYGISDEEYVDLYGKELEKQVNKYIVLNNTKPDSLDSFENKYSRIVSCDIQNINDDNTVYLSKCNILDNDILDDTNTDGYYHYGKELTASQKLLLKANDESVTNYNLGNKGEMYTFSHSATEQTGALIDYRYIGASPNNYVYFNNNELWRIIGLFSVEDKNGNIEQRIKIVRNEKLLRTMSWDSTNKNEWKTSTLNKYLNDEYYNSFDENSKIMVDNTKYYLGGSSEYNNLNGEDYYNFERGVKVYGENSISWVGKIALMYPSDYSYTYALGVDDICYNNGYNCHNSAGKSNGWIHNTNSNTFQWLLSPASNYAFNAFYVNGFIGNNRRYDTISSLDSVRPSLYLISNIKIESGDGSEQNPYKLKL